MYIIVKINSKYKEDDFTDSNADVNSLDVCVHRILFCHEATTHVTFAPHLSTPPGIQSAINTQDIHNSISTLAPS